MRALTRPAPRVAVLALALGAFSSLRRWALSPLARGTAWSRVMDATYQVLPEEQRVHVTVDAVSTSHEADTPEGRVYYAGISMTIPPGATNVAATSNGTPQSITVSDGPDAVRVDIGFSEQIFFNESFSYQLTFDLVDQGGAANRDFRIGHSVVAFPVWAFGSAGVDGNSVAVDLPPTFTASVYGGPLEQAILADGTVHLTADNTDATSWVAYVTAERPGIFTVTPFSLNVGDANASVIIRAWDDDPQWSARTMVLLTDGLPALQQLIGLAWPVFGDLKVEESANRLGDYAGIYNPLTEKINVRYDADATVALHEAAHVWFNDHLFRDRWIGEAWAEFYAVQSAEAIGVPSQTFSLDDSLLASKIPLNDWGVIGAETQDVEAYAYAASFHLANLIFARTDLADLRAVWQAADAGEMAYQPLHDTTNPRTGVAIREEDWQRLLDLLEERTGATYDDLWADWVVNGGQRAELTERSDRPRALPPAHDRRGSVGAPRVDPLRDVELAVRRCPGRARRRRGRAGRRRRGCRARGRAGPDSAADPRVRLRGHEWPGSSAGRGAQRAGGGRGHRHRHAGAERGTGIRGLGGPPVHRSGRRRRRSAGGVGRRGQ